MEGRTGWRVVHHPRTTSTNDVARDVAHGARTVVVADEQTAGRGRAGRTFASPPGGLYASLVVDVPAEDIPAGVVALVALAAAEAIEGVTDAAVAVKWPNDLWIGRRKVGGILLERRGDGLVVAGIGVNLMAVPAELPASVRAGIASLADVAPAAPARDDLLEALLLGVDRLQALRAGDDGAVRIESAWRQRIALLGRRVTFTLAGTRHEGVLQDVSLHRGLLVGAGDSPPVWRAAEHVSDLAPADRTI